MTRYEIVEGGEAIKCLACGLTSHHPKDVPADKLPRLLEVPAGHSLNKFLIEVLSIPAPMREPCP
jgi:hypothetical protein